MFPKRDRTRREIKRLLSIPCPAISPGNIFRQKSTFLLETVSCEFHSLFSWHTWRSPYITLSFSLFCVCLERYEERENDTRDTEVQQKRQWKKKTVKEEVRRKMLRHWKRWKTLIRERNLLLRLILFSFAFSFAFSLSVLFDVYFVHFTSSFSCCSARREAWKKERDTINPALIPLLFRVVSSPSFPLKFFSLPVEFFSHSKRFGAHLHFRSFSIREP